MLAAWIRIRVRAWRRRRIAFTKGAADFTRAVFTEVDGFVEGG
jgi:hypothetical protein